jgi:TolA-binding protein
MSDTFIDLTDNDEEIKVKHPPHDDADNDNNDNDNKGKGSTSSSISMSHMRAIKSEGKRSSSSNSVSSSTAPMLTSITTPLPSLSLSLSMKDEYKQSQRHDELPSLAVAVHHDSIKINTPSSSSSNRSRSNVNGINSKGVMLNDNNNDMLLENLRNDLSLVEQQIMETDERITELMRTQVTRRQQQKMLRDDLDSLMASLEGKSSGIDATAAAATTTATSAAGNYTCPTFLVSDYPSNHTIKCAIVLAKEWSGDTFKWSDLIENTRINVFGITSYAFIPSKAYINQ